MPDHRLKQFCKSRNRLAVSSQFIQVGKESSVGSSALSTVLSWLLNELFHLGMQRAKNNDASCLTVLVDQNFEENVCRRMAKYPHLALVAN